MKRTADEIKKAIAGGEILGVALDTSIFSRKRYQLEHGVLPHLEQLKHSRYAILIPNVVRSELARHLRDHAREAEGKAIVAIRAVAASWNRDRSAVDAALENLTRGKSADIVSEERLTTYLATIGASVLTSAGVTAPMLQELYFKGLPPFEQDAASEPSAQDGPKSGQGKKRRDRDTKKHEFPDAIALLTLEQWAASKRGQLLVLSYDDGWRDFCEISPHKIPLEDLTQTLALFQDEAVAHRVTLLGRSIGAGDPCGFIPSLGRALNEQAWKISFHVDAMSDFSFQEDVDAVRFVRFQTSGLLDEDALALVQTDDESITVAVTLLVTYRVDVSFSFSKWDSVDRESLPLGGTQLSRDADVDVELLIHLTRDGDDFEIESVEVIEQQSNLELSEVEPAWMRDPENYG